MMKITGTCDTCINNARKLGVEVDELFCPYCWERQVAQNLQAASYVAENATLPQDPDKVK